MFNMGVALKKSSKTRAFECIKSPMVTWGSRNPPDSSWAAVDAASWARLWSLGKRRRQVKGDRLKWCRSHDIHKYIHVNNSNHNEND